MTEMGPGQYFGDLSMLYHDYFMADVRAKTHVEVLQLSGKDLFEVLEQFPLAKTQIMSVRNNTDVRAAVQVQIKNWVSALLQHRSFYFRIQVLLRD